MASLSSVRAALDRARARLDALSEDELVVVNQEPGETRASLRARLDAAERAMGPRGLVVGILRADGDQAADLDVDTFVARDL